MTLAPSDGRDVTRPFGGDGLSRHLRTLVRSTLTAAQDTSGVFLHGRLILTQLGEHRGGDCLLYTSDAADD